MKGLYLNPTNYPEWGGVTKKITSHLKAFRNLGCEIFYMDVVPGPENKQLARLNNETFNYTYKGLKGLFHNFFGLLDPLSNLIAQQKIDFIYFRYRDMNPAILKFLRYAKRKGVRIVTELPTYPYDGEQRFCLSTIMDRVLRRFAAKYFDRIATYSADDYIWGVKTIQISNGVDIEDIPLRESTAQQSNSFTMVTVAHLATWHGFDRMIDGIANYYRNGGKRDVRLQIIGSGDPKLLSELKDSVSASGLSRHVTFEGIKSGNELDQYFDSSDLAIGSLGRHRSGVNSLKTLKNVEYASRGIPFIYSENNSDFDNMPYILKIPADESPVDIEKCIEFCVRTNVSPKEIRATALQFDWKNQIKKILNEISHL